MHFRLKGPAVPSELRDLVASMTDRAKLRPEAISTDPAVPELHLLIQRFPLIRQRRILPNVHDLKSPLPAVVTIRQVVTADIDSRMPSQLGGQITLLFGIQLEGKQIHFSSAEEDRGVPCFSARIEVAEIDLEMHDLPHGGGKAFG